MDRLKNNQISILASLIFPLILTGVIWANHLSWSRHIPVNSVILWVQSRLAVLWLIPLPVAVCSLVGLFLYEQKFNRRPVNFTRLGNAIYFRLATRGNNPQKVIETVKNVVSVMNKYQKDNHCHVPFLVEVVTEAGHPQLAARINQLFSKAEVNVLEVPRNYETVKKSKFKARALHFALENSGALDKDWIFHLDDESQIDCQTVHGICEFIQTEEDRLANDPKASPRIGQGTILYYRNIKESWLYTLADSIRTADDMGRYFLQYLFRLCIFGMHGSFILVRNNIEKVHGFDLDPKHCITEDAYWGLMMMQKGYLFGHVFGFVHEQSPAKGKDFIKQRRRWFVGISEVIKAHDIKLRYKIILFLSTSLWAFSGPIILYTALNIIHPAPIQSVVGILSSFTFAIYVTLYILGFYINMQFAEVTFPKMIIYFLAQLFFIPIFAIMEAAGATYGLLDRKLDFYVIKK